MRKFINGKDLELNYGLVISNGTNMLMQLPDRKDSQISNDFLDENGLNIVLFDARFAARTFTFDCTLTADNVEDFKIKYFGLFRLLIVNDTYTYFDEWLNMTVNIYYQKQLTPSQMYKTQSGGVGMTFQLQFGERNPFDNIPYVELADDGFNVLVP